jgi:hypothetical protein
VVDTISRLQDDLWEPFDDRERARLRAEGYRIVNGGQDGPPPNEHWTVTDEETGEVLAEGRGLTAYDTVADQHPEWFHADRLLEGARNAIRDPEDDP